jgi:hypothetical protein
VKENLQGDSNYEILLKKKMHSAEIYQNWIYVPAKIRKEFPLGRTIVVKAGKGKISMKVNSYGYMSPETALWDDFVKLINFDKEHDKLVFIKHKDGTLEIAGEKE